MKNFDRPIRIKKCNYITLVYKPQIEAVNYMFMEHYDKPEYDDTVFFINTVSYWNEDAKCHVLFKNSDFPHKRKIYYNLEHGDDCDYNEIKKIPEIIKYVGITEVWSFEPNVEVWDTELGIKFMPLRYTSLIEKTKLEPEKKFDLGFVGIVGSPGFSPRRNEFFNTYITNPNIDFSIKILNGYNISDLKDELANCKFILDSKRNYRHNMQNQVRLYEHICLGHTVLSEKSVYNMFPGMIYEWDNISELNELIKTVQPQDMGQKYKELTYTNEAYEQYKRWILSTFYEEPTSNYFFDGVKWGRTTVINNLIAKNNFKSYLEIGVADGDNFNNIHCDMKIGVDPDPNSAATHHMTSDEYFNSLNPNDKFDIIFIDGLHLWEQCYRDINNALNHLSPNGVIVCHDMNPLFEMFQGRDFPDGSGLWNGDVWRAFIKVRTERDDVNCQMIEDCDYGVGIIRFGNSNKIRVDKPVEDLTFRDFTNFKAQLMNTVKLNDFIKTNQL